MGVVAQGADALQAVHDRGVVFRNVWKGLMTRTDGTQVLTDFHVAPDVRVVIDRAAALNPAERWPSAAALAEAARG
jgi:hypothetical protein